MNKTERRDTIAARVMDQLLQRWEEWDSYEHTTEADAMGARRAYEIADAMIAEGELRAEKDAPLDASQRVHLFELIDRELDKAMCDAKLAPQEDAADSAIAQSAITECRRRVGKIANQFGVPWPEPAEEEAALGVPDAGLVALFGRLADDLDALRTDIDAELRGPTKCRYVRHWQINECSKKIKSLASLYGVPWEDAEGGYLSWGHEGVRGEGDD